MANSFRPWLVGILLFTAFAICLIFAGLQIANNTEGQSIADDPTLQKYYSNIQAAASDAQTTADAAATTLGNSTITISTGFAYIDAIGGLWKAVYIVPKTVVSLTLGYAISTFGTGFSIVLGLLGAIITISIIFAVWKLISQGESG